MRTSKGIIQPGFLVVGDVRVNGCATYSTSNHNEKRREDQLDASWSTEKNVKSVSEQRAVNVKKVQLCYQLETLGAHISGFGYLVPLENAGKLEEMLSQIGKEVDGYNISARYTRLDAFFTVFEITANDERVAAALYKRVTDLVDGLNEAVLNGNLSKLRGMVRRLANLDQLLPPETALSINKQIEGARAAAKEAMKRTKDLPEDKQESIVKKILKKAVVADAVRADLVEKMDVLVKSSRKKAFLSPVDVRNIE